MKLRFKNYYGLAALVYFGIFSAALRAHGEYLPGLKWQEPPVVTPAGTAAAPQPPPSDAIVLFDGTDLSAWDNKSEWPVENGVTYPGKDDIQTKQKFGDCQLHLEWMMPKKIKGRGQGRGNSGVYFMPHYDAEKDIWVKYEIQILDSYRNKTYFDGQAAAVYKQSPPMVNAMRPPGEWNTYDIAFTAPRFNEDGTLKSPAYVTVLHNGVVVQANFALQGYTSWYVPSRYVKHAERLPIGLQHHNNKVLYRNIWVRDLHQQTGKQIAEPMYRRGGKTWKATEGDHRGKRKD